MLIQEHGPTVSLPQHVAVAAIGSRPGGYRAAAVTVDGNADTGFRTCIRIFRDGTSSTVSESPTLTPTVGDCRLTWNLDGSVLAVTAFNQLVRVAQDRVSSVDVFPRRITGVVFDDTGALWLLAGGELWHALATADAPFTLTTRGVAAIACRRGGLVSAVLEHGVVRIVSAGRGEIARFAAAGEVEDVELRGDRGDGLVAAVRTRAGTGFCRLTLVRAADAAAVIFSGEIGRGIAEPAVCWDAIGAGEVAVVGELDDIRSVWIASERGMRRLGDPRLDVESVSWNPDGSVAALCGRDWSRGGSRRSALVARNGEGIANRDGAMMRVSWHDSERFLYAFPNRTGWKIAETSIDVVRRGAEAPFRAPREPYTDDSPLTILAAPSGAASAILYVTGPHRFVSPEPDLGAYHQLIRREMFRVSHEVRALFAGLNATASLRGGARIRRGGTQRYWQDAPRDVAAAVRSLRALGAARIVLVATSLGVPAALAFLAHTPLAGAVLVNPVYGADSPVLEAWSELFGPWRSAETVLRSYAPTVGTPLLVVHGMHDEISPSQYSSDLLTLLPSTTDVEYLTVPDEGHVFRSSSAWATMLRAACAFARAHLA